MYQAQITKLLEDFFDACDGPAFSANEIDQALILDTLFRSLRRFFTSSSVTWLKNHLKSLFQLQSLLVNSSAFEDVLRLTIASTVPFGLKMIVLENEKGALRESVKQAEMHWSFRTSKLDQEVSIVTLLERPEWTTTFVDLLAALLYKDPVARQDFWEWLQRINEERLPKIQHLAMTLMALFESSESELSDSICANHGPQLSSYFNMISLLLINGKCPAGDNDVLRECVVVMWDRFPSLHDEFASSLRGTLKKSSNNLLYVATRISKYDNEASRKAVLAIVNIALQWCTGVFSTGEAVDAEDREDILQLGEVLRYI